MEDAMAYADSVGATVWLLVSASLVLLMTPALAFFYGGMSRKKSVLNMMMMSFGAMGAVGVAWMVVGNSLSTGPSIGGLWGNPVTDFLLASTWASGDPIAIISAGFGATFAIITTALISGAIADRVKFGAWMVFAAVWSVLVYAPLSHWVWGGGILSTSGPLFSAHWFPQDFAGGTVVHINAGVAGLVLALMVGVRRGFGREVFKPHNLPLVMLGAALLWIGWFGFNAGSAFAGDVYATVAWVNTTAATAAAILGWLAVEKLRDGKPTSLGAASGVVAGLVAITPAAAQVDPAGALLIGVVAGALSALAVGLKYRWGYDDSLDVVGVHLVSGLWGTLAVGLVGTTTYGAWNGLFYGGGLGGLAAQAVAALITIVFSAVMTAALGYVIKRTIGWRVSHDVEVTGIDLAEHGETAYEEAMAS